MIINSKNASQLRGAIQSMVKETRLLEDDAVVLGSPGIPEENDTEDKDKDKNKLPRRNRRPFDAEISLIKGTFDKDLPKIKMSVAIPNQETGMEFRKWFMKQYPAAAGIIDLTIEGDEPHDNKIIGKAFTAKTSQKGIKAGAIWLKCKATNYKDKGCEIDDDGSVTVSGDRPQQPSGNNLGEISASGLVKSHKKSGARFIHLSQKPPKGTGFPVKLINPGRAIASLGVDPNMVALHSNYITDISLIFNKQIGVTPLNIKNAEVRINGGRLSDKKARGGFGISKSQKISSRVAMFIVKEWLKSLSQEELNTYFNI